MPTSLMRVVLNSSFSVLSVLLCSLSSFFSHCILPYIPTTASLTSGSSSILPPSPLPSSLSQIQIHCSCISLHKRSGFPVIPTEHSITRYSNNRHKPLYYGWKRQPSRRKGILRAGKKSETSLLPPLRVTQKF